MIVLAIGAKVVYEYAVTRGYMGERELDKYEHQKSGQLGLLSGRAEFVPAFFAIRDSPILGYGSWALDTKGYNRKAWVLMGDEFRVRSYDHMASLGRYYPMPGHSHIWGTWVSNGAAGAIFWLYVLTIYIRVFRKDLHVVPMLFGYLAIMLPAELWGLWFSGFGDRVGKGLLLNICLLVDHIRRQARMRQSLVNDAAQSLRP